MTTDLETGRTAGQQAIIPTPACIRADRLTADKSVLGRTGGRGGAAKQHGARPGPAPARATPAAAAGTSRSTARAALAAALSGVRLTGRDRQFLSRLVHWDKRNAASVASLLRRARQAGRDEAVLTPRQAEVLRAALADAARYRASGFASASCWDCDIVPGGRCAEHAKDSDRARAYSDLAATVTGDPRLADGAVLTSVAS